MPMTVTDPSGPVKLLIVERDEDIVNALKNAFSDTEFHSEKTSSIERAFERLHEDSRYLVMIVDVDGSEIDGLEFLSRLRREHLHVPLIVLSENPEIRRMLRTVGLGNADFFRKPVEASLIVEAVRRMARMAESGLTFFPRMRHLISSSFEIEYRTDEINPNHVAHFLANMLFMEEFCNEVMMNRIEIAIHESIINAIEHGNLELTSVLKPTSLEEEDKFAALRSLRLADEEYGSRKIRITFKLHKTRLEISISDQGTGFDHEECMKAIRDGGDPEKLLACYGRGLVLIVFSVDEIVFDQTGATITLIVNRRDNTDLRRHD